MGYLNRVKTAISLLNPLNGSDSIEVKSKEKNNFVDIRDRYAILSQMIGGNYVTPESTRKFFIDNGYTSNADVFSVINIIAKRTSTIPWNVYVLKDKKKAKQMKSAFSVGNYAEGIFLKEQAWEIIENSDLSPLLENPNECQSFSEFIEENIGYLLATGNSFIYGLRAAGFSYKTSLINLPAHIVEVDYDGAQSIFNFKRKYSLLFGKNYNFTNDEVLHRKYWSPAYDPKDALYGLSPLQAARFVVKKSNDSYISAMKAYQNSGIAGIISSATGAEENYLSKEDSDRLQAQFDKDYTGPHNFRKLMATSAAVSYTQLGLSPVDLDIIEAQKMDLKSIANVYGVPVQLLNSEEASTYDNMEKAERGLFLNTAIPQLVNLRDQLNKFVTAEYNKAKGKNLYLDFDVSKVPALQPDLKSLSERLTKELAEGIWTRNEIRKSLGGEPKTDDPVMDQIILPNKYNQLPLNQ